MATFDAAGSNAEGRRQERGPRVAETGARGRGTGLELPTDADLQHPAVLEAVGSLRGDVAFHLMARMAGRPAWLPSSAFERVDGLMDVQAVCASDGAPFDPHTLLMRHATEWRDVTDDGPEAQVRSFANAYAVPIDERAAAEAQSERLFAHRPPDGGRKRLNGDDLRADAIEALSKRISGPGARLRPARGYHGGVQRSPFIRKPRDGAHALAENLERVAERIARAPIDPILAAAVAYAWLLGCTRCATATEARGPGVRPVAPPGTRRGGRPTRARPGAGREAARRNPPDRTGDRSAAPGPRTCAGSWSSRSARRRTRGPGRADTTWRPRPCSPAYATRTDVASWGGAGSGRSGSRPERRRRPTSA